MLANGIELPPVESSTNWSRAHVQPLRDATRFTVSFDAKADVWQY